MDTFYIILLSFLLQLCRRAPSTLPLFFAFVRCWSNKSDKWSGLYVMCCVIPTLLEHLAANSGINEILFAKAALYLWQWSMLWWGMNRKAWTTFCVISSVSRCGKNFLYKRNQSTSYIRTWPFSHKPKLSTSVFPALSVILLVSWIWSLLKRSIKTFRAIAEWLEHRIKKITQKVKVVAKWPQNQNALHIT